MKRIAVLAACCLAAADAGAQAPQDVAGQPVRIVITKVDCSRLVRHVPAADVAYQPGVDARGRAVAPADMPGSGAQAIPNLLPDVLEFPITINPVGYGARIQAQRDKAAAAQDVTDSYDARVAAQSRIAALTTQKGTLTATGTTLATEKAALDTRLQTLNTSLAAMQADIAAGTRTASDRDYTLAKQQLVGLEKQVADKAAAIDANNASLSSTNTALSAAQSDLATAEGSPSRNAAQAQVATLTAQKTVLTAKGAALSTEKAALDTRLATVSADLTTMTAEIAAGTRAASDRDYTLARMNAADLDKQVAAKGAAIAANDASLASTNAALTAQQALAASAPDRAAHNAGAQAAADAKLAKLSGKGLDSTTMQVATVRYDMAKGTFTVNGQPLGSPEQEELARACQKQGVR